MKNLLVVFFGLLLLQSCNSEKSWDCVQTVGEIIEVPYEVPAFSKITVEDDIFLEIEHGDNHQVFVTTGSNLINEISVEVEADGTLRLKNYNACNFIREYDVTKIKVITPTLTFVRSSSRNKVTSSNTLNYSSLALMSNTNVGVIDAGKSGDFDLNVAVDTLSVSANGFSGFKVSGTADFAFVGFYDEIPLFDGANLIIQDLRVLHVSGNKMTVNPQQSIKGSIRSIGDVISLNQPPIVDVEELFTGRLIFQ